MLLVSKMSDWYEKRCDDRHDEERRYLELLIEKQKEETILTRELINSQLNEIKSKIPEHEVGFFDLKMSISRVLIVLTFLTPFVLFAINSNMKINESNIQQENRITKIETKITNIERKIEHNYDMVGR